MKPNFCLELVCLSHVWWESDRDKFPRIYHTYHRNVYLKSSKSTLEVTNLRRNGGMITI